MYVYVRKDLTYISTQSGLYYLIEYKDLLSDQEYFGDIFDDPSIIRDQSQIHEVHFEKEINNSPTKQAFETSIELKNKYRTILKNLDSKRHGNPNLEQAYLILSHFEERWLEADNLTFNDDGTFIINQWGISPRHINFPEPPQIDKSQLSNEDIEKTNETLGKIGHLETRKFYGKSPYYIALAIILLFLFGGVIWNILNDNTKVEVKKIKQKPTMQNTRSTLKNSNSAVVPNETMADFLKKKAIEPFDYIESKTGNMLTLTKPRIRLKPKVSITDSKTGRELKDGIKLSLYDDRMLLLNEYEGEAIDSFTLNPGYYKLAIHNKKYFSDTVTFNINRFDDMNELRYFPLIKKGFFRRIIEKFKK